MTRTLTYTPFHAPSLFDRAEKEAREGKGVITAILSAATVEAFTHDFTSSYRLVAEHKKICPNERKQEWPHKNRTCVTILHTATEQELSIYLNLVTLEKSKASTIDKFCKVHAMQNSNALDKGKKIYQNLKLLFDIRNAIMHPKDETFEVPLLNSVSTIKRPRFLSNFQQKGYLSDNPKITSWFELIETEPFSQWCVDTAKEAIEQTLAILPDSKYAETFKHESRLD